MPQYGPGVSVSSKLVSAEITNNKIFHPNIGKDSSALCPKWFIYTLQLTKIHSFIFEITQWLPFTTHFNPFAMVAQVCGSIVWCWCLLSLLEGQQFEVKRFVYKICGGQSGNYNGDIWVTRGTTSRVHNFLLNLSWIVTQILCTQAMLRQTRRWSLCINNCKQQKVLWCPEVFGI